LWKSWDVKFVYLILRDGVPLRARQSIESAKAAAERLFPVHPEHQGAQTEWRDMQNGEALVFTDPKTGRVKLARLEVIVLPFSDE
jgi:hypothetical protein